MDIEELEAKILQMVTHLEVMADSSFNVDKKAIQHQLVAYKNVLRIIDEGNRYARNNQDNRAL